jgi:Uma2 family endonuclease
MATDVKPEIVEVDRFVLEEIDWKTYLALRDNPANDGVRMTFLDGTLYLMSPEIVHESDNQRLGLLIRMVVKSLGWETRGIGSTTLRRAPRRVGKRGAAKKPDCAFYLGENELRMRGQKTLDLTVDPPPDLAIEIDNKADSSAARPVYARLGVPEVWRYAPNEDPALEFLRLIGKTYEEIDRSICLPILTPALVLDGLSMADSPDVGEIAWMDLIVAWARGLPRPPA